MQPRRATAVCLGILLVLCYWAGESRGQLSKPVAHDSNMKEAVETNKYLSREASDDMLPKGKLNEEALHNTQCPQHVELRWQTEVSSSVYATPVIADINSDGKLEVVVPTFVHYLEALEGADGEKIQGFPAFHQSTAHASPILYDIDQDGVKEILLATFNGEVLFFRNSGYLLPDKLTVPRLRVKKDWFVGLDPDWVDRSQPDVNDDGLKTIQTDDRNSSSSTTTPVISDTLSTVTDPITDASGTNGTRDQQKKGDSNASSQETQKDFKSGTQSNTTENKVAATVQHLADDKLDPTLNPVLETAGEVAGMAQSLQQNTQRRLLVDTDTDAQGATVENDQQRLTDDAEESFRDLFTDDEAVTDEYNYDYDDYVDESMWGDEEWTETQHEKEEDWANIDAHILATPVIADIDNDGIDEMIIAASFFYDHEYYESPEHKQELGDIDIGKYVACSIVVFNLQSKEVKWSVHLDLSTDAGSYRALTYSSPTVVDFDGDGFLEIVVGTSLGFVYVLRHNALTMEPFPMQMGEIQAQVIAADINDDGLVEIVAADTRGNVAAWNSKGKEVWERHLKSLIAQGPTVGDVDGDGHTDIVISTASGNVYVLKGSDGSNVAPYPFRTHGRVMAPPLLVDLNKRGSDRKGLTIAVTSFDGYFYLIDGVTGCADAIDIGETSYSMVVADNVDGGDDLDLIVTTMNGNVLCFQTPSAYHPLKAWPAQTQGRNVVASRYNQQGIFISESSRKFRDEAGDSFWIQFEIVDQRHTGNQGTYKVKVTLLVPGNYQGERRIVQKKEYLQPGPQKMKLPCLPIRTGATVLVEMTDKHGFYFSDEFSLTFHMRYYRLLKWLLVLPLMAMAAVIILIRPQDAVEALPSFASDKHSL